ncbi:MAG: ferrochelatase [Pseudomonadota bacterium]
METINIVGPGRKTAVVLFNLGGPDGPQAVQPFLFNLFNDRAIIGLPNPFRRMLASFISRRRAPTAQLIYEEIGGKSPIVENTQAQAKALESSLNGHGQVKVFPVMRYWHPMSDAVAQQVKDFAPDHVILLPLYPQFSTTTTGSSFKDWDRASKAAGLHVPTSRVCCYPTHNEFIKAHAQLLRTYYQEAARFGKPRILFSAHGLPEKIIKRGDPYQAQVEETTRAVMAALDVADADAVNCYQSRVGPLKWIGPSTISELMRAGRERLPVVLVPIAFVSEHSETLVELDIEYADMAHENGIDHYYRVPTLSTHAHYIAALSDMCLKLKTGATLASDSGARRCGPQWTQCPCKGGAGV